MDSVIIQPGAAVCADAEIIGDVRIGAGTVVHPRCRILAQGGPVIIGENNIIEELTVVVNPNRQGAQPTPMVIGSGNWFEIGDDNHFEPRCVVEQDCVVASGCVIGAGCAVAATHVPDDFAVAAVSEPGRVDLRPLDADHRDIHKQHVREYAHAMRDPSHASALSKFHHLRD